METPKIIVVLLAGTVLFGLSSCNVVRTFGKDAATEEDFLSCKNKACFIRLINTQLIQIRRLEGGGERVIYAIPSRPNGASHTIKTVEEPLYLYFEVNFEADGSLSNIKFGKPLCVFDSNHQRNCSILSADEVYAQHTH